MIQTGEDLIAFLKQRAKESKKFFFNRDGDEENANALVAFYKDNYPGQLESAINMYLKREKDTAVTLGTFVQGMTEVNAVIAREKKSKDDFDKLLADTQRRMEELD